IISPDQRYDDLYLSNYATLHLLDELLRVKGVGDISLFGQRSYAMRIWLDPYKMTARNLTTTDVVNAIRSQNVQVAAGQVGQEPVPAGQELQLTMSTLGRLETEKQFGDIVIKTAGPASSTASTGGSGGTGGATGSSTTPSPSSSSSAPAPGTTTATPDYNA